ncbi:unnamed protein product [Linum trigynum]|uniref:Uncharacterized protein n=1 Tax=Linum trigynum TaxID=586398 RepID=A0AAV2DDJ5_9ROSI
MSCSLFSVAKGETRDLILLCVGGVESGSDDAWYGLSLFSPSPTIATKWNRTIGKVGQKSSSLSWVDESILTTLSIEAQVEPSLGVV